MAEYDVAIIGAGVTGAALLYALSRHTDVGRIALLEKYQHIAQVNSKSTNNSQTLHFGDIETNYPPEKARKVAVAGNRVARYLESTGREGIHRKYSKMVLGVGAQEAAFLRDRYEQLKESFPRLQLIGRRQLAVLEPMVVEGRPELEEIVALYTPDGYAVDFGKLSESFIRDARKTDKHIDDFFGTKVDSITRTRDGYRITSDTVDLEARTVVAASGAHSLLFAHQLGYGREYGVLPVAGNFYKTPRVLSGKVYTVQDDRLPFAAVHGDPDTNDETITRFGPTAKVLPLLERRAYGTFLDFIKSTRCDLDYAKSLFAILSDKVVRDFALKNIVYDMPFFGRRAFLKDVRKIVPTVALADLTRAHGVGGLRPQLIDKKQRKLCMGEAKIIGDNIIFDITPSPGASVCLKNAEIDAERVTAFLGKRFDRDGFEQEFGE